MNSYKTEIIEKICYTELVYDRINKKLNKILSKTEIETFILFILNQTEDSDFYKKGKNIYVTNQSNNIRLTINSNNFRIITFDNLKK